MLFAGKDVKLEPEALNLANKLELYVFASEKHRQAVLVARLTIWARVPPAQPCRTCG